MLNKIYIFVLVFLLLIAGYFGFTYLILNDNNTNIVHEETIDTKIDSDNITKDEEVENKEAEIEEAVIEPIKNKEVIITAAGDLMAHIPIVNSAYNHQVGGYDFTQPFKYIKELNKDASLRLINLETVTKKDLPPLGFPNFNTPYEIIYGAKYGGFNVIGTANNHSYDQGKDGVLDTISRLEDAELSFLGTNKSENSTRYRLYNFDDLKVGLMCYTYGLNGHVAENEYLVNIINLDKMKEDIDNLKKEGADKIILFVHWGVEYNTEIYEDLRNLGHSILDLGVDYILGSHPHVVMPVEHIGEKFIVYSMGNFLSNQRNEYVANQNTEEGLFVKFTLEKDILKGQTNLKNFELIPIWVDRYYTDKWNYRVLPIDKALNNELEGLVLDDRLKNDLIISKNRVESIIYRHTEEP